MRKGWEYKKLGEYVKEYSVKNKLNENIPVYSVTNSQGFCKDYFGKEVASKDKSTYKIVPLDSLHTILHVLMWDQSIGKLKKTE